MGCCTGYVGDCCSLSNINGRNFGGCERHFVTMLLNLQGYRLRIVFCVSLYGSLM
ncbi:hypothetical protein LINPERHAP1_LOCUS21889 [Linum perenne]